MPKHCCKLLLLLFSLNVNVAYFLKMSCQITEGVGLCSSSALHYRNWTQGPYLHHNSSVKHFNSMYRFCPDWGAVKLPPIVSFAFSYHYFSE